MLRVLVVVCQLCGAENVSTREEIEAGAGSHRCVGCGSRFGIIHLLTEKEFNRSIEISNSPQLLSKFIT